jgi:hypothetical protein
MITYPRLLRIFIGLIAALPAASIACALHFGDAEYGEVKLAGASQAVMTTIFLEKNQRIQSLPPVSTTAAFQRASWWLRQMAKRLSDEGVDDVHIVLVDIPMWSKMDRAVPLGIDIDIEPPSTYGTTYMLTQTGLNAIMSQGFTLKQAREMGLIRIHQPV